MIMIPTTSWKFEPAVIVQPQQILRLSRKMTLVINPFHTWNAISNARSNSCHWPTSPNAAPATKSECHDYSSSLFTHEMLFTMRGATSVIVQTHLNTAPATESHPHHWSLSHMKRIETLFTMRGATAVIVQPRQILRLPRKMTIQNMREIWRKQMKRHLQCATDPRPFREWSEHDPTMKLSVRNPPRNRGYFSRPPRPFCIEKYNISRSAYHSKFHRILRLPRKVTIQLQQLLRLPRKVTVQLHQMLRLARKVTLQLHQILRLPRKVTLELHEMLRLPRQVTLELHEMLRLPRKVTWRCYYLTMLLLRDAITWRCCYFTMLWLYNAITLQCYYLTMLLLNDAITGQCYYFTMLFL